MTSPFDTSRPRPATQPDIFAREEVRLANRNSGNLLESLDADITPLGMHYLLNHFDVPMLTADSHVVRFEGAFDAPFTLSVRDIRALPQVTRAVTLECAGNGRAGQTPRHYGMPWGEAAVGTYAWTGTPLAPLIARAKPRADVVDFAFFGADFGYDDAQGHFYGRSLSPRDLAELEVLLVTDQNGQPLLPQHGAPLRIVVPGWYGMASVKWLTRVEAMTQPFDGFQQIHTYRLRDSADVPGIPITTMRPRALLKPPGVPDWISRARLLDPGPTTLTGRAWSGAGLPIDRVEVLLDGHWRDASLGAPKDTYAWTPWHIDWIATEGDHAMQVRATDAAGVTQPLASRANHGGFCNNAVQTTHVYVRKSHT